ncbi:MAG: J domain-containing protein [Deltaproteobacteria bacterium]|nr:J domain-containing protein [Deltaproteobacteria bacterium]
MKEDLEFMERITRDLEARKAACKILDVEEGADKDQLKKAYRRAVVKYHPDHNTSSPEANKMFTLIKCAHELLAEDKPCPELLKEINAWPGVPENDKYRLENPWGHFLWWREKFFASAKRKNSNGNRSSCI